MQRYQYVQQDDVDRDRRPQGRTRIPRTRRPSWTRVLWFLCCTAADPQIRCFGVGERPPSADRSTPVALGSGRRRARMLNFIRQGAGPPLLLVHGLGGSWRSWTTILPALAEAREVVALNLPGHGETPMQIRCAQPPPTARCLVCQTARLKRLSCAHLRGGL